MLNILLVTPLNVPYAEIKSAGNKLDPKWPIGLLSIGSYLKNQMGNKEVSVEIVDYNTEYPRCKAETFEELLEAGVRDFMFFDESPDIIGISAMFSSNLVDIQKMITFFRIRFPKAKIVGGGHVVQFVDGLDAISLGEGEKFFADYVKNHRQTYFGIWEEPFPELDEIPPYDLSLLRHQEDYYMTNTESFTLGNSNPEPEIAMFASRGCPHHCIFCASQHVHGHKVRRYSVERIKHDIDYYAMHGFRSFPFLDDDFFSNKKEAMEVLQFIYDRGFKSRIFNVQYLHMDREILEMLKKTGSDRILVTPDGLNEQFLRRVVKKPANFKKCKEVIKMAREVGLTTIANILIGFPGETKEMIEQGVKEIIELDADWYAVLTAVPFQGSELYDICKEKGYLSRDTLNMDYHTAVISTPDFTPEWIEKKAYEINLQLNFVQNRNMVNGDYEKAIKMFDQVIKMVPDHAMAYQMSSVCRWIQHLKCVENSEFWMDWMDHFKL